MAAKATGYLELNISGFDQALKTAKNLMATFAAGFAAYKIGDTFKEGIKDAINFGKEMNTASRAMGGFGAGNLLLVQKALEKTGMDAQTAQGHISDFIKSGRDISEMFGGTDNYAEALKKSAAEYGDQSEVLTRSAARLQTVWNSLEVVTSKARTFFLAMTEQFIGPLQLALDALKSVNLADVGAKFGGYIADAAKILYGLFKSGDLTNALSLGLKVAFQEGVNYLAGGLRFILDMVPEWLIKGFDIAAEFFMKSIEAIMQISLLDGFLYVSARFTASLLDGMNTIIRVLQVGVSKAVMEAIMLIPGAGDLIGIGTQAPTFAELYNDSEGPISMEFIDKIAEAGDYFADAASEPIRNLIEGLRKTGNGEFSKMNVFDTAQDSAKLQDIIAKGFQIGNTAAIKSEENNTSAVTKGVLTNFTGSSSKVIADSLAKVGGGGGFLRVGMTLAEKTAMQQLQAQTQSNKLLESINKNTEKPTQPATMRR